MSRERESRNAGDGSVAASLGSVRAAFEDAWRRNEGVHGTYVLADQPTRLRVAGVALGRHVCAPFAHLRASDASTPDLTIDVWDVDATGVAPPRVTSDATSASWIVDDGALSVSSAGRVVCHATPTSTVWLDRRARHIVGCVASARALPMYERARPLQMLLALCAYDRGIHAVHGALVARDGRAVLLAGDSGSGKSTAALCAFAAGFSYLGDDWIGIRQADGVTLGYSLYSSVSLDPAALTRFPALQSLTAAPAGEADPKAVVLLADSSVGRIERSATVAALALPRLVDAAETRVRPAAKKDALLTMARSAICTMRPRGGRATVAALTGVARECPAYWLELGRDLTQIPVRIDDILAGATCAPP